MSTPSPPNPNHPQQPGQQSGPPGPPAGQPPGPPAGQGYGANPSYSPPPQSSQPTQQWHQPPPPPNAPWGGAPAGPGGAPYGTAQNKSFFAKLFDLSFSEFITPSVVKIVYVLAMVGVGILWLSLSIAAFQSSAALGLFVLLVLGPLYALFLLILIRITFEFYVAVIRIAEDVRVIRKGR